MVNLSDKIVALAVLLGFVSAQVESKDVHSCRRDCYDQFFTDLNRCRREVKCREMDFLPPNIDSYIPEAFSFLCYEGCDEKFGPFQVRIQSMERKENLVMTNITWDAEISAKSKQCLVTWEVFGGGLMGNLLTDCCIVELSLWPDTAYNVHVTCKNKRSGQMRRSIDLFVDTTGAKQVHKTTTTTTTTDNNYILEQTSQNNKSHRDEAVVGAAISIMIFIAIVAICMILRSRRNPKIIEEEILIHKELGVVPSTTLHV